jgi:hypothetical protein
VVSSCLHDEIVEIFKIAVVSGKSYPAVANGAGKVNRIVYTREPDIHRKLDIMPSPLKELR